MMQQSASDDLVIATGRQWSVRHFIGWSAHDLKNALRTRLLKEHGLELPVSLEG